jgi:hypothetical protein
MGNLCGMLSGASNPFMYKMQQVSNMIILHLKEGNENNRASNDSLAHNATIWSFRTSIYVVSSSIAAFLALSSSNSFLLSVCLLSCQTMNGVRIPCYLAY